MWPTRPATAPWSSACAAEAALPGGGRLALTRAVARNLASSMAYKDEYEVARQ